MPSEKKFGLVQMFWGKGKGKTTAAVGEGFRAAGRGFKVHMIQFLKGGIKGIKEFEEYGELIALKKFPNFTIERFGIGEWLLKNPEKHREIALEGLAASKKVLSSGKYDIVILDEILYAATMGAITMDEVKQLVKGKNKNTELILTGSHKRIPELEEIADLVTHVEKIKHPFDKGIPARIGTEF